LWTMCLETTGSRVLERVQSRNQRPVDERALEFVAAWNKVAPIYNDASDKTVRDLRRMQSMMATAIAKEPDVLARLRTDPAAFEVRQGSKLEAALQSQTFETTLHQSIAQFQSYTISRASAYDRSS
jgi:hypothetical protein